MGQYKQKMGKIALELEKMDKIAYFFGALEKNICIHRQIVREPWSNCQKIRILYLIYVVSYHLTPFATIFIVFKNVQNVRMKLRRKRGIKLLFFRILKFMA